MVLIMHRIFKKLSLVFFIKIKLLNKYVINLTNSFFFRILIVLILNVIYYSLQWDYFRTILGEIEAWMFTNLASMPTMFNFPGFKGGLEGVTWISASCLYIEMYCYIMPFLFDRNKSIIKNIIIIVVILAIIQVINIARIYFSVLAFISLETSWFIAHDLPDTLIWYPITIGIIIYGALRFEPVSLRIERNKKEVQVIE
jgi:exosortase/archaeosortase family protein